MNIYKLKVQKMLLISIMLGLAAQGCKGKIGVTAKPPPRFYKITASNLHGVDTVGTDKIWAVGAYGSIHHSADGGKQWTRQTTKTENLLCAVDFVDEKTGWATGIYGLILHTEDGGQNWKQQITDTEEHLFNLTFLNKKTGWVVGAMGTLLHTSDGGKTWIKQRENEDVNFNAVCFIDQNTGWVVGEFGRIFHTTDGGAGWARQKPPTLFLEEDDPWGDVPLALYDVKFIDKDRGWVVGMEGLLLRTEDGGKTWADIRRKETKHPFYAIEMIGDSGWIVGGGGNYFISNDAGKSWQIMEDKIKTRFKLLDINFSTPERGWVVGARGAVVTTEDAGKTWTMLSGLTYDVPEFGLVDF